MSDQGDEIKIMVTGLPKVGKSTVVQIMTRALEDAGFTVGCVGASFYMPEHQAKRIDQVNGKIVVQIEEHNVRKNVRP